MRLQRSKKYSVGKAIGSNTWVHKQYENVFPKQLLLAAKKCISGSDYTVVKYDSKTDAISFIQSPDFDTADEPLVGDVVRISSEGVIKKIRGSSKNPMIYHHKWLMVEDDYPGFDVGISIERSKTWKSIVGVNSSVSSRIGRRNYWLDEIVPKLVEDDTNRSGKTAMTRRDISRPTKTLLRAGLVQGSILHHGCGKAANDSKKLKELAGGEYAEYDPTYAPDRSVLNKKYTTVISNYVMNTLPKEARSLVWRDLARCTGENAYITIRQGDVKGKPFKEGVLTSKKTFQVFLPDVDFVVEAKEFFTEVEILHRTSSLLMVRCR